MKLGLITDVHADPRTLNTAVDRLEQHHQVDQILCMGDLTGYGNQPVETLDLLIKLDFPTVRGNHDMPSRSTLPAHIEYLKDLPIGLMFAYDGYSIYACHGLPEMNMMGFSADMLERPHIQQMVEDLDVDFVLTGHTHVIFCQQVGKTWILNPGSLYNGSNINTTHSYGVLDLGLRVFSVFDITQPAQALPILLCPL
jgi:putative phosphoesterase